VKKIAMAVLILLAGCDTQQDERPWPRIRRSLELTQTPGLQGCVAYQVDTPDYWPDMLIVRCPNNSTSVQYKVGKRTDTTITVDGEGTP